MMTKTQRAKLFSPFDAMKGLKEALAAREERHSRVQKRELSEEESECLNSILIDLRKGDEVKIVFFRAFHEVEKEGVIEKIDLTLKYLVIDGAEIPFDDLYLAEKRV